MILIVTGSLYTIKKLKESGDGGELNSHGPGNSELTDYKPTGRLNKDEYKYSSSRSVDSVLHTFGIVQQWITTYFAGDKTQGEKSRTDAANVLWYTKYAQIPKDLSSAEINLELTNYFRTIGLEPIVNEDIRTRNLSFTIYPDRTDTLKKAVTPLSRVYIRYSDKIKRESGVCALIINNLYEFKGDELDDILNSTRVPGISFIFPRGVEHSDIQNKLIQQKKDVIIKAILGVKDDPEADFNAGMSENELKKKIRKLYSDFPSVSTVIISPRGEIQDRAELIQSITSEFGKYKIAAYPDTMISFFTRQEKGDKAARIAGEIRASKKLICVLDIDYSEYKQLTDEIGKLRKLGYKFYTFRKFMAVEKLKQMKIGDKE